MFFKTVGALILTSVVLSTFGFAFVPASTESSGSTQLSDSVLSQLRGGSGFYCITDISCSGTTNTCAGNNNCCPGGVGTFYANISDYQYTVQECAGLTAGTPCTPSTQQVSVKCYDASQCMCILDQNGKALCGQQGAVTTKCSTIYTGCSYPLCSGN
jgi:hypothetical protein